MTDAPTAAAVATAPTAPTAAGTRARHLAGMALHAPQFLQRTAARYGPIVRVPLSGAETLLVTDPEATRAILVDQHAFPKGMGAGLGGEMGSSPLRAVLGNGLLTSRGEHHKRQRRLIQPAFHHQRIAGYAEVMAEEAAAMTESWRDGDTVDVHAAFARTTLAILTRTVFDVAVTGDDASMIKDAVNSTMKGPGANVILVAFARRFGVRALDNRRAALAGIDEMITRLVAERRACGEERSDVLSWLLAARDEDGSPMAESDIRDEVLTLLLAGHETSTNALSWAYYLLGRHPAQAARLHEELDSVLGDGRRPTVDDLAKLHYTRAVADESMRLYPPAWIMVRHAAQETTLAGHRVPRGATLLLSPYVVHRDPKLWRDAATFDPARWLTGPGGGYQAVPETRHAYFPFGGGQRMCIGNTFALMEIAIVLAHVSRHWTMSLRPGHRVGLKPRVTLRPRGGMPMVLHAR